MDDFNENPPTGGGLRDTQCSICKLMFTQRGLKRHQTVTHGRNFVPDNSTCNESSSDMMEKFITDLLEAREKISVMRIVPRQVRSLVGASLKKVVDDVVELQDVRSWKKLFSFSFMILRLPPSGRRSGQRLPQIVKHNLQFFNEGKDLDAVIKLYPTRHLSGVDMDKTRLRQAVQKLSEGDVRAAVRHLVSADSVAQINDEVLNDLKERHPPAPLDDRRPNLLQREASTETIYITPEEIRTAVKSFPVASSGGIDGYRPRHLRDLLNSSGGIASPLYSTISNFCEMVANGGLPDFILKYFFGALLTPLKKKSGGIRPIACGLLLRRLVTKVTLQPELQQIRSLLLPSQVGCAVKGGIEAAIHAARLYASSDLPNASVLVKLDFINAFNLLRRDWMLEMVMEFCPRLYPLVRQAYGGDSVLWAGKNTLRSATGVQQGDPAGPALFCIGTKQLTDSLSSELSIGYLDDITLAGPLQQVLDDIQRVQAFEWSSGLRLNPAKCEVFPLSGSQAEKELAVSSIQALLPGARLTPPEDLELLGSPLCEEAFKKVVEGKCGQLRRMLSALGSLNAQQAWYLLRNSLGVPRLIHMLRTSPFLSCTDYLKPLDTLLRQVAGKILNINVSDYIWTQICLPLNAGGMGVRIPSDLAAPCYLSSLHSSADMMKSLLPTRFSILIDDSLEGNRQRFLFVNGVSDEPDNWSSQNELDTLLWEPRRQNVLNSATSDYDKARLLAAQDNFSRKWLNALPSSNIGTLLDSLSFRVCAGLRLGAAICHPHTCTQCNSDVDALATHGLSCRRSRGRHPRHTEINKILSDTLTRAGIPNRREPANLVVSDGRRPDGVTLVPWEYGRCLVWDATVVCTLAQTHVKNTARKTGAAANRAEARKKSTYFDFGSEFIIQPVAFETFGVPGEETRSFLKALSKKLSNQSDDPRVGEWFLQNISLCLQRGNAASVLGSMATSVEEDQV